METRNKSVDLLKDNFTFFLDGYRVKHFTLLLPGQVDPLIFRTLAGRIFGNCLCRVDFAGTIKIDQAQGPTVYLAERVPLSDFLQEGEIGLSRPCWASRKAGGLLRDYGRTGAGKDQC